MASGSNPSSKRKFSSSSSSHKKKPSNKSSEVRKRKRSRSRKRDKLRKRSRRELSVSCSDDDSRTEDSVSVSFSDSDDDYRRRKERSRTRVDGKRSKKKSKRSSSVRDDSRDSTVRKKRKESKGRDGSEVKKKYRHGKSEKEGSRRGARVDYFSGDSESCSTCRGGSDSEDSYFERSRGRSKGREKNKTRKGRDKDRDRYRSRSCSACSEHNEHSRYQSEERLMDEKYSRRLKSVLSVPNEYEEEEERYQGEHENTEEVILAYDDCPSSKSNDSYDGGRKKETFSQPYTAPETRREYDRIVEDDSRLDTAYLMNEKEIRNGKKADDAFATKSKISQSARMSKGDVGAQYDKKDRVPNMESSKTTEDSEVSTGGVSSVAGDLETILRQKALENFKKFRGGQLTNTILNDHKDGNDIVVKQLRESEHEPIKTELRRKADNRAAVAKSVEALGSGSTTRVEGKSVTNSLARGLQIPDDNSKRLDDRVVDTKATQKRIINLGNIRKSNQDSVVNRRESSDDHSVAKHAFLDGKSKDADTIANKSVPETPKAAAGNFYPCETNKAPGSTSSETKSIVNKIIPEPPKVAVGSSDPSKTDNTHVSAASEAPSDLTPATGEHGSTESGKAATGDSEFQQKTMSVMRGGEMVQVSYKVYIPKRAPALARRQLRR